jgi:hypothetical protein
VFGKGPFLPPGVQEARGAHTAPKHVRIRLVASCEAGGQRTRTFQLSWSSFVEWCKHGDTLGKVQVLHHVAHRLQSMHAAGWAHLDLKPGNILRRPMKHSWTLIDFGCSAKIGAHVLLKSKVFPKPCRLFVPALLKGLAQCSPNHKHP